MLDGTRESIQPMAERLADGNEQALQQFISQSPGIGGRSASGSPSR
jgi:hypothetical protein